MFRGKSSILLFVVALLGCQSILDLTNPATPFDWAQLGTGQSGAAGPGQGTIQAGGVRVQITNASGQTAEVRVTMDIIGRIVHFGTRHIPLAGQEVFIGPDHADSVVVDVTLDTTPPLVRTPLTFLFGRDFNDGDTILIVIASESDIVSVSMAGLDTDIRVRPGMLAAFSVRVAGDTTTAARVSVFADPDGIRANGDEIPITTDLPPASDIPVQWTVPDLSPGRYAIYAELRDVDALVRSAPTVGAVRVDAPPQLTFTSPPAGLAVTRGRSFIATWVGGDVDDSALITIFLDTNTALDGNEPVLRSGIDANNAQDRQLTVDTSGFAAGTYFIGGLIDDGLIHAVAYAGPVCITERLVGRLSPSDLGANQITTITGGSDNRLLGTAVDISRRLAGPAGNTSTVLVSDPGALNLLPTLRAPVATGEVELYQHSITAPWPRNLAIADMTLRMIGEQGSALTGQAIALLDPVGAANPNSDILLGASGFLDPCSQISGRAYFLKGSQVLAFSPTQTTYNLGLLNDSPVGALFQGAPASATGLGVAALGDIDGSGQADYAIGATNPGGLGSVYLFTGNNSPGGGLINQAFSFRLIGVENGDLTGFAIAGVADVNGDTFADVAVGAPLGRPAGPGIGPQTGLVYLVFGSSGLLVSFGGSESLGSLGGVEALDGRIFAGENAGDQVGAAIASADFDGDGKPDLLIGAPGFAGGRGRAYLIYDVGNAALPRPPAVINLGLVGTTFPGAIFDGLAVGDQLGFAVASGGDFDGDGVRDILLGAPGVESQRGAAYLIYGQLPQRLQGSISLANVGTCSLPSLELIGEAGLVSRLGTALSSGDLHGDGRTDLAIGAPGDLSNPGQAHLLFGRLLTVPLGRP